MSGALPSIRGWNGYLVVRYNFILDLINHRYFDIINTYIVTIIV